MLNYFQYIQDPILKQKDIELCATDIYASIYNLMEFKCKKNVEIL